MAKTNSHHLPLALVFLALAIVSSFADEEHHVVGDDRGWDQSTDVGAWSTGRIFRAGDSIWFAYSAASEESIAELRSKEEFEACDLTSPLKLYSDGLDKVRLDSQGHRFFISTRPESCKNGLKLHVEVLPPQSQENIRPITTTTTTTILERHVGVATGPTPSGSVCLRAVSLTWLGSALLYHIFSKV